MGWDLNLWVIDQRWKRSDDETRAHIDAELSALSAEIKRDLRSAER